MHLFVRLLGVFLARRKFVVAHTPYNIGYTPVEGTFSKLELKVVKSEILKRKFLSINSTRTHLEIEYNLRI